MKTLAVNSNLPNFKALHIPRDYSFSASQLRTLEDIENKVNQAPLATTDFYIAPRKNDSLELFIYNKNTNKKDTIGLFNENYPFEPDETSHNIRKKQLWNNKGGSIFSIALLTGVVAMLLSLASSTKNKPVENQNFKQIVTTVTDSIKPAVKDTLTLSGKILK